MRAGKKTLDEDRSLPEWLTKLAERKKNAQRRRGGETQRRTTQVQDKSLVDANNVRLSWKNAATLESEAERLQQRQRLARPEEPRSFPFPIRPVGVREGTVVATYAIEHGTRKKFLPASDDEPKATVEPEPPSQQVMKASLEDQYRQEGDELDERFREKNFLRLDESKLPLETFDSLDFEDRDKLPQEWLRDGANENGDVLAYAAYYDAYGKEAVWRWRKCKVLGYDSESRTFEIRLGLRNKRVTRLNLRFVREDERLWTKRREAAYAARDAAKQQLRLDYFISQQPTSSVSPIKPATLRGIHSRISDGLRCEAKATKDAPAANQLHQLTTEAVQAYARAMKRAIVRQLYITDCTLRDEYLRLKLPAAAVASRPKAPKSAKIAVPTHPYADRRAVIAQSHASSNRAVLNIFSWLSATWEKVVAHQRFVFVPHSSVRLDQPTVEGSISNRLSRRLSSTSHTAEAQSNAHAAGVRSRRRYDRSGGCDSKKRGFPFALPCHMEDFVEAQEKHCYEFTNTLQNEWRAAFTEQIIDNVQDVFDFFQSNKAVFDAGPLKRFLTHVDLWMTNQLREVFVASLEDFLDFVRRFTTPSDSDSDINEQRDSTPQHVVSGSLIGMATPPLFNVKLEVSTSSTSGTPSSVRVQPSYEQVEAALLARIDQPIEAISELTCIDADVMSLLHLEKRRLLDLRASSENLIEQSPLIKHVSKIVESTRDKIRSLLRHAFEAPQALADRFGHFAWIADVDAAAHVRSFVRHDAAPSLDEYVTEVRRFHDAAERISSLSEDNEHFRLCAVDTTGAKAALGSKAKDVLTALLQHVVLDVRAENEATIERYEQILARLAEIPQNEAQLAALKEFITESKKEVLRMVDNVKDMHERLAMFDEFKIPMSQEDTFLAWSTMEYPKRVHDASNDCEARIELDKVRMMDKLAMEKNQFEEKIQQFEVDVKRAKGYSDYANEQAYVEEINRLQDAITEAKSTAKDFNEREQVFGFPPTEYAELDAIEAELNPFWDLWNMISDFHTNRHEWLHGAFLDLDGGKIQREVEIWWKQSYKLKAQLEELMPGSSQCAAKLREETDEFRGNLPLIRALASPALKERHWAKLSDKIGHRLSPFDESGIELTLQGLLDMNTGKYIEEIQEVCFAAEKEYKLERDLQSMRDDWALIQFDVKPYKETGTCIVGGIDDIITLLDDHIVKTQTMCGSMFIKAIEEEAKAWEAQLKYGQALLDEWIACQRVWMYLEPIFGSEDIMRQLPTEARRFNDVDKLWRTTMKATEEDPVFIAQADPAKKLKKKFAEANEKLDKIQKGLSDYLETKRLFFPRFFFLADEQMLEILSQTKEPRAVQPHLGKAFEGLNQVNFESDLKITEMISCEGERVALNSPVDPESPANRGNVERWLLELEQVQWHSVRKQVELSLAEYPKLERAKWTLNWPAQAVLATSQMYWTQEVEATIKDAGSAGLKNFVLKLNDQLTQIVMLVRGKLTKLQRKTLSALVVMDVHARDTIASMATARVEKTTDFNWISQLRYYWEPSWKDGQAVKKGDNTVVARIVNARCLYGYEYLGNSMRLVITPLTDRCYRTMISAIDLLYGGAPEGPAGTGKTETVKDLSKAMAIQCVVFNCTSRRPNVPVSLNCC